MAGGREAAGFRAVEPRSHPRQSEGKRLGARLSQLPGVRLAGARDGPQEEGEEERDTPSRKTVMPGLRAEHTGGDRCPWEFESLAFYLERTGGTARFQASRPTRAEAPTCSPFLLSTEPW